MTPRPAVLCPVDFSEPSAAALRYGAMVADHFRADLVVLTVDDPLLTEARDLGMQIAYSAEESRRELIAFTREALRGRESPPIAPIYEVAVGKPAGEILRVARDRACDLIVIGSHGSTGVRKLFFGSTTERLLRSTAVPVLVTRAGDAGPARIEDAAAAIGRILVPVDLASDASRQLAVAAAIGSALRVPVLVAHVVEPLRTPFHARAAAEAIDADRRRRAVDRLIPLVAQVPYTLCESTVGSGDPSEAIARLARERGAGLIVLGLHSSRLFGPRMGSVTYRTLCRTDALVLALPPELPVVRQTVDGEAAENGRIRTAEIDGVPAGVFAAIGRP